MESTPYRVTVAATGYHAVKRYKNHTKIARRDYGYILWTPVQTEHDAGRLPSSGSFLFPGLYAVRAAALAELAKPTVHQVAVRTNQDRVVYIWNKHVDGRISGYGYTKQEWAER